MKKTIIIFLLLTNFVNGAVPSSKVNIELSWDGGNTYTTTGFNNSWYCQKTGDTTRTYGNSTELWGRTWTIDELNNNNFTARLNLTVKTLTPQFDNIRIKVYYEPPQMNVTLENPTPANDSLIGSTLQINASSNLELGSCLLEHNATGTFINTTMYVYDDFLCAINYTQIPNNTIVQFRVYANDSTELYANFSESRIVTVNSLSPTIELHLPINDSNFTLGESITFNWTTLDNESDLFETTMYLTFEDDTYEHVYYHNYINENGTFTYDFRGLPLKSNLTDLLLLYRFNMQDELGENITNVYNHVDGTNNGTLNISGFGVYTPIHEPSGGYFDGAFYLDGSSDWIECPIVIENQPISVSLWARSIQENCAGAGAADQLFAGGPESRNGIQINNYNCSLIYMRGSTYQTEVCSPIRTFNHSQWNHYVVVSTGNDLMTLYLNGEEICNETDLGNLTFSDGLHIGHSPNYPGGYLNGSIDEFAIWNKTLNSTEIAEMYQINKGRYYWNMTAHDGSEINITETWQFTIYDTCTWLGGNWTIDCNDNCTITETYDLNGNYLIVNGLGHVLFNNNITNISRIEVLNSCLLGVQYGNTIW